MVQSASPVPVHSPPLPIAVSLISAKNSGKLRKHTARSAFKPSLSSLFSLREPSSARRRSRESHLGESADNESYAASARNVYLCSERLIREMSDEMVLEKSARRGVRSKVYADARSEGFGSGARSSRKSYSACDEHRQSETAVNQKQGCRTSATLRILATQLPNSLPASTPSTVSTRSMTRLP
jgi:hypothetical protein